VSWWTTLFILCRPETKSHASKRMAPNPLGIVAKGAVHPLWTRTRFRGIASDLLRCLELKGNREPSSFSPEKRRLPLEQG
jgi:hypothetical protein